MKISHRAAFFFPNRMIVQFAQWREEGYWYTCSPFSSLVCLSVQKRIKCIVGVHQRCTQMQRHNTGRNWPHRRKKKTHTASIEFRPPVSAGVDDGVCMRGKESTMIIYSIICHCRSDGAFSGAFSFFRWVVVFRVGGKKGGFRREFSDGKFSVSIRGCSWVSDDCWCFWMIRV